MQMEKLQPQKRRRERKHRKTLDSHSRSVIYLHSGSVMGVCDILTPRMCDGKKTVTTKSAEGDGGRGYKNLEVKGKTTTLTPGVLSFFMLC